MGGSRALRYTPVISSTSRKCNKSIYCHNESTCHVLSETLPFVLAEITFSLRCSVLIQPEGATSQVSKLGETLSSSFGEKLVGLTEACNRFCMPLFLQCCLLNRDARLAMIRTGRANQTTSRQHSEHRLSKNQTAKIAGSAAICNGSKLHQNLFSDERPRSRSASPVASTSPLPHS